MRGVHDDQWLGMALLDDDEDDALHHGLEIDYLLLGRTAVHQIGSSGNFVGLLLHPHTSATEASSGTEKVYVRKGVAEILGLDVDEDVYTGEDSLRTIMLI
jgi:hypothetical protein